MRLGRLDHYVRARDVLIAFLIFGLFGWYVAHREEQLRGQLRAHIASEQRAHLKRDIAATHDSLERIYGYTLGSCERQNDQRRASNRVLANQKVNAHALYRAGLLSASELRAELQQGPVTIVPCKKVIRAP